MLMQEGVPARSVAVTPQRLLVSQAMPELVAEARGLADVVLVDTAPALLAKETLTLVPAVDSVILVGRRNRTTREQARKMMRLLEPFMVPILGVVMTGAPRREIY
jgi:Mrp family chromosome partitioning ATPase